MSHFGCGAANQASSLLNSEERVRKGAEKLEKFLNAKQQGRLDGFFTVKPKESPKKDDKSKGKGKGKGKEESKGTKRKVGLNLLEAQYCE